MNSSFAVRPLFVRLAEVKTVKAVDVEDPASPIK